MLNVLRVTDFISELYEPSDRKYTVDTKLFFCLFVVDVLLFVLASENSKFFRKKKSAQCALQLYKLHSASTDVDMLQSE